ncbi:MAG: hypothetical protein AAFU63_00255 [Pseudomonadota bacterium]
MQLAPDDTVVVAGNGPSLSDMSPGTVLADDVIIRTNSFFFEPSLFLGQRVDLAMMGGDSRVAPFVFETLWRCRHDYDLRHWSSHNPRVARAGFRRFKGRYVPMPPLEDEMDAHVKALCASYDRELTTGVQAVLMAYGLGARRIILVGFDLYTGASGRYTYAPGPHYRDLMGTDIGVRGVDHVLHDTDLDRAVLALLNEKDDTTILAGTPSPALRDILDPAPLRKGPGPRQIPREAPPDWAAWAGIYPIGLMKLLRRGSALSRRITGRSIGRGTS